MIHFSCFSENDLLTMTCCWVINFGSFSHLTSSCWLNEGIIVLTRKANPVIRSRIHHKSEWDRSVSRSHCCGCYRAFKSMRIDSWAENGHQKENVKSTKYMIFKLVCKERKWWKIKITSQFLIPRCLSYCWNEILLSKTKPGSEQAWKTINKGMKKRKVNMRIKMRRKISSSTFWHPIPSITHGESEYVEKRRRKWHRNKNGLKKEEEKQGDERALFWPKPSFFSLLHLHFFLFHHIFCYFSKRRSGWRSCALLLPSSSHTHEKHPICSFFFASLLLLVFHYSYLPWEMRLVLWGGSEPIQLNWSGQGEVTGEMRKKRRRRERREDGERGNSILFLHLWQNEDSPSLPPSSLSTQMAINKGVERK